MADLVSARAYHDGSFSPQVTAWLKLTGTDGDAIATRTLIAAARMLDLLPWQGAPTGMLNGQPTPLAWPRTGVVVDGVAIDSTTVPVEITRAEYELAPLIFADPSIQGKRDTGSNIRRVGGAGVPEVEFWAPTSAAAGTATLLPVAIQRLVGKYLASPSLSASSLSAGGSSCAPIGGPGRDDVSRPT